MLEFKSPGSFANHLLKMAAIAQPVKTVIVDGITDGIAERAKAMIGQYQPAYGEFPEWAPLADSTEAEKARLGYPADAPLLRKGELRDSIEKRVEGSEGEVGSTSEIAAYQEFGTEHIPPRPFIGPAALMSVEVDRPKVQMTLAAWLAGVGYKRPRLPSK